MKKDYVEHILRMVRQLRASESSHSPIQQPWGVNHMFSEVLKIDYTLSTSV